MALALACRCGSVRGLVEPDPAALRGRCYCQDCQAYARFLGRADDLLDAHGGSDVVQTMAKFLTLTSGVERLACVRMTPGGPLRWYAACCNTPIANTAARPVAAFMGLVTAGLAENDVEAAFGPVRIRTFTAGARGEPKPPETPISKVLGRIIGRSLKALIDGSWRATPFFDLRTRRPVAEPRVLMPAERAGFLDQRQAA